MSPGCLNNRRNLFIKVCSWTAKAVLYQSFAPYSFFILGSPLLSPFKRLPKKAVFIKIRQGRG